VHAIRTPIGALGGSLATIPAPKLGASCIQAIVQALKLDPATIDEVIMGNVVSAGVGQAPARQAAIFGGLPPSVGALTVNKVCGSGLKAVMLADQAIRTGEARVVIAGGMESMSRAPYMLAKAREGYRLGNAELIDAVIHDGLRDAYTGESMGVFGERCVREYEFTRREQDDFAVRSFTRARRAIEAGWIRPELVPIEVPGKGGKSSTVDVDEGPGRFDEAKLRGLKPSFDPAGTITAGNASSLNDGAAAHLVASAEACSEYGLRPVARIMGSATFSQAPEDFTTAPIGAIQRLLRRLAWTVSDVGVWEINEAFAAVTMAAESTLSLDPERVNVFGGAVALGHPIGCSGARILVTLLNAMGHRNQQRGIASLCIGGGEAVAVAVERYQS
jgi:acetyl-CoA C-acetyltransferase